MIEKGFLVNLNYYIIQVKMKIILDLFIKTMTILFGKIKDSEQLIEGYKG